MAAEGATVTCRDCGATLIWHPARFAWAHRQRPDDDHAPRPVRQAVTHG